MNASGSSPLRDRLTGFFYAKKCKICKNMPCGKRLLVGYAKDTTDAVYVGSILFQIYSIYIYAKYAKFMDSDRGLSS